MTCASQSLSGFGFGSCAGVSACSGAAISPACTCTGSCDAAACICGAGSAMACGGHCVGGLGCCCAGTGYCLGGADAGCSASHSMRRQ